MSARIRIQIDDAELDAYMLRLDDVLLKTRATFGAGDPTRRITIAEKNLSTLALAFTMFDDDQLKLITDPRRLPTINRELRIIARQVPGLSALLRPYFDIKRLERGAIAGGMSLYLATIASLIIVVQQLRTRQRKMDAHLDFLRTSFSDYFRDPEELAGFALEQRLTWTEKMIEQIIGWFSAYVWEPNGIVIEIDDGAPQE